jgi:FKBP-type peptidyl-prolyl cis-trans isomerase FkpA
MRLRHALRSVRFVAPLAAALLALGACSNSDAGNMSGPSDPSTEVFASSLGVNLTQMTQVADRLYVQDLAVGSGAEATSGKQLRMRYTGWLRTGTQFDSNTSANGFGFVLGVGQVIDGWDIGVAGMKVGGRRRLVFGSQYGYGPRGSGPIPPNATLVFDVELVSVQN